MFAAVGYNLGCQANVFHHTVSSGRNPEADISYIDGGKDGWIISNGYVALDGTITLIASGPTYTEGKGGPRGLIGRDGANRVSCSWEIASMGAHDSKYPTAQQDSVLAIAAVMGPLLAELYDWHDDPFGPDRQFSHFEWAPGRKVDPRGVSRWSPRGGMWDMNSLRAEARAAAGRPIGSALVQEDDEMNTYHATPDRIFDSRTAGAQPIDNMAQIVVPVGMANICTVNVTAIASGPGWLQVSGTDLGDSEAPALLNFDPDRLTSNSWTGAIPDGKLRIRPVGSPAHVIVEVSMLGSGKAA